MVLHLRYKMENETDREYEKSIQAVAEPIRVLLLDDHPENLLLRSTILRKYGYLTETAATVEEAEKLLDKLASNASNATPGSEAPSAGSAPGAAKPKYLRIVVDQPGRDPVNVRVPLSLVRSGRGLLAIMPKHVKI